MRQASDILSFSHLRWNFVFQRPQHLMVRWARDHRVFFFEEPLYDSTEPGLSINTDATGVHVVTPHLPRRLDDEQTILRGWLDSFVREHYTTALFRRKGVQRHHGSRA